MPTAAPANDAPLGFAALDDLGDVTMVESGQHLAFTVEAVDKIGVIIQSGDDGLDRKQTSVARLTCEVNGAHAA